LLVPAHAMRSPGELVEALLSLVDRELPTPPPPEPRLYRAHDYYDDLFS
jgi:hypothetical protein